MNNDTITLKIINGIYDINPIIKLPISFFESSLLVIVFVLLICITIYLIWKFVFSKKAIAIQKIKYLQTQYKNNTINTHNTIYQLCSILRDGLDINKISKQTTLPNKASLNKYKWNAFSEEMSVLRYKNKSESDITHLFKESVFWLKNWS